MFVSEILPYAKVIRYYSIFFSKIVKILPFRIKSLILMNWFCAYVWMEWAKENKFILHGYVIQGLFGF